MKKFLFITTLTPAELQSPLRKELFGIYLKALHNQTYSNWQAILIGEYEKEEGKVKYIKSSGVAKSDKLKDAYEFLKTMSVKPDYIIRLDDDDIISPLALEQASQQEFDCYADLFHSFYDLTSGTISQQKRAWLPNTIIHKYKYAVAEFGEKNIPLFMHNHSKSWHVYYSTKKIYFSDKNHPLYLRVISPTTISSGFSEKWKANNVNMDSYKKHLATFGEWKDFYIDDFNFYKNDLAEVLNSYFLEL